MNVVKVSCLHTTGSICFARRFNAVFLFLNIWSSQAGACMHVRACACMCVFSAQGEVIWQIASAMKAHAKHRLFSLLLLDENTQLLVFDDVYIYSLYSQTDVLLIRLRVKPRNFQNQQKSCNTVRHELNPLFHAFFTHAWLRGKFKL